MNTGSLPWTLNHPPLFHSLKDLDVSYKSARIKAWAAALATHLDEDTTIPLYRKLLTVHKGAALVQIGKLREAEKRPGSCFLFEPRLAKKTDIADWSIDVREKHFVDDIAYGYYLSGDLDSFMRHRENSMFAWEKDRIILPAAKIAKLDALIRFSE